MKMIFICFGLLIAALLAPMRLFACSICGCGDPLDAAGQSMPHPGQIRLGLDWSALQAESAEDDDPARFSRVDQQLIDLDLGWSPSADWTLLLKLPYQQKAFHSQGGADDPESGFSGGLGDVEAGARWFFARRVDVLSKQASFAALGFGSSFNSGATQLEQDGVRLDEHEQPGTGALGPYLGLLLVHEQDGLRLSLHTDEQWRSTNASGYQYGGAFRAGLSAQLDLRPWLSAGWGLEGRYADRDHDWAAGADIANSGGTAIHIVPSLGLRLGETLALTLKAQLPAYIQLFGSQSLGPVWMSSLQWLL
jgi:hypothetical protein